jgi:hypothetical protein
LGAGAWLVATGSVQAFLHQSVSFTVLSYLPANFQGIPRFPREVDGVLTSHPWAAWLLRPGVWVAGLVLTGLVTARLAAEPFLRGRRLRREVAAVAVVGAALSISGLYRPAAAVLWSSAPLTLVVVAGAVRSLRWAGGPARRRVGTLAGLIVLAAAFLPATALALQRAGVGPGNPPERLQAAPARISAVPPARPEMEDILSFAGDRPDELIAFLPAVKAMYLVTERPPPIPYVILRRGYNTDEQVRDAMGFLDDREVRWIVYAPGLRNFTPQEGEWIFDRFLEDRYELRRRIGRLRFGPLLLYERRP